MHTQLGETRVASKDVDKQGGTSPGNMKLSSSLWLSFRLFGRGLESQLAVENNTYRPG